MEQIAESLHICQVVEYRPAVTVMYCVYDPRVSVLRKHKLISRRSLTYIACQARSTAARLAEAQQMYPVVKHKRPWSLMDHPHFAKYRDVRKGSWVAGGTDFDSR